jgi:SAM-dependent methyltransferase
LLEAGCGTGGNLQMLSSFGELDAFEYDESARLIASGKSALPVYSGCLPDNIPFTSPRYDVIAAFDVLEHVERDVESLACLARLLASGGRIFLTVPALPWLWSRHDVTHHHYRRYTRRKLLDCLRQADLKPVKVAYFNTLLFPIIAASRLARRFLPTTVAAEDETAPPSLNHLLTWIFASESVLVGRVPLPIGVSLLAIAERRP